MDRQNNPTQTENKMKASFETYCEDYLNLTIGLMSEQELQDAKASYEHALTARKSAKPAGPQLKLADLRTRCESLVKGQKYAVAKHENTAGFDAVALNAARAAVAEGERLLAAKRSKKDDFVAHAEMNGAASRLINAATNS